MNQQEELQRELEGIIQNLKQSVELLTLVKDELVEDVTYTDKNQRNHIYFQIESAKKACSELDSFKEHYTSIVENCYHICLDEDGNPIKEIEIM